jgi:DNA-directed RNA polymerase subunit alpha
MEDVTEIILNLKQIRFRRMVEDVDTEKIVVKVSGQEAFKAGDLNNSLSSFEVLNPELVICRMEPDVKLQIESISARAEDMCLLRKTSPQRPNSDLLPSTQSSPLIRNVKYSIENYRVEQKTDYEKLILEITTDGSIHPKDALKEAAKILIYHFMLFSEEKITIDYEDKMANEEFDEEILHMRQLLKTKLVDLDLSVRALNCLKAAEVESLGDLVKFNKNDLLKFRNFGKKSLTELDELLETMNLSFGMDVAKYKLDKD